VAAERLPDIDLLPANGDSLSFAGLAQLNPVYDLTNLGLSGLAFGPGAGAFTPSGNALTLTGPYANASTAARRIQLAITVGSDQTWTDSSGGSSAGANGAATILGGATWATTDRFHVGLGGNGTLLVQGGGRVEAAESDISHFGSSTSTATVTGAGSTWASTADLKVGVTGRAKLNVTDGGLVSNRDGDLGYVAGAGSEVRIAGTGSTRRNSRDLTLGLASGTSNQLSISAGGLLAVGGHLALRGGSVLQLDNGTLQADTASRSGGGRLAWLSGQLERGTLNLDEGTSLIGQNAVLQAGLRLRIGHAPTAGTRLQLRSFGSLLGNGLAADRVLALGLDRHPLNLDGLASTGTVTAVPVPGTWALWLGGLAALGALARRRATGQAPAA